MDVSGFAVEICVLHQLNYTLQLGLFYFHYIWAQFFGSIDYSNSVLIGISQGQLSHLQLVQNTAARFFTYTKKRERELPPSWFLYTGCL